MSKEDLEAIAADLGVSVNHLANSTVMLLGNAQERDAAFLRMYADLVRDGKERTLDIPSVVAATLDGIAQRIQNAK